jgi:hypothetical protein
MAIRLRRPILTTTFALVACAGASLLYAGIVARGRFEPSEVRWGDATYAVVAHREDQALVHEFRRNGRVVETLAGSTDTLCDDPWIMLIDVDGDDRLDVYHRTCGGHGYLKYMPATDGVSYVDLGQFDLDDAPILRSSWASEIMDWHGLRLIALGAAAALVGAIGLLALAIRGRRPPMSPRAERRLV